jgi:glycosyltransferase involved in cell wall biosynthesis
MGRAAAPDAQEPVVSARSRREGHPIRLLVVNQRMDRTGAPMQLVALLPGLAEALGARITLLRGPDGPLTAAARPHVAKVRGEPLILRGLARFARSAPNRLATLLHRVWLLGMRLAIGRVDVVYVNSLISARLAAPFTDRPMVLHVHELGGLAATFGEPARELVRHADRTLVPSRAAIGWVVAAGATPATISVISGAVPPAAFEAPDAADVDALAARLGIGPDHAVIATVGWIGALKGADRFLDVAARLTARSSRSVRLLWVGGGSASGEEALFREDIRARGLSEAVQVLPTMEDLRPLYARADIGLVTSREESLSLVALECAAQGTPVVCFPGAGGPDALAEEGVVNVAASPDVDRVVDVLVALLDDEAERRALGARARARVAAGHGVAAAQGQLVGALTAVTERGPDDG